MAFVSEKPGAFFSVFSACEMVSWLAQPVRNMRVTANAGTTFEGFRFIAFSLGLCHFDAATMKIHFQPLRWRLPFALFIRLAGHVPRLDDHLGECRVTPGSHLIPFGPLR
jgi:hypothetical protein